MKPRNKGTPRRPRPARKQILLVEDHPLTREGVARWIKRQRDMEVCSEVESVPAAHTAIEKRKPDLVLLDVSLSGGDGLELIKDIRTKHPTLPVLVFSMHEETLYAPRALRAGARGYVNKQEGGARLIEAIREVLAGRVVVSPALATRLLEEYSGHPHGDAQSPLAALTDREFEVFRLLGEAKTTREIAEQLHLSCKTVETHRLKTLRKLKLKSSVELIRYASLWSEP